MVIVYYRRYPYDTPDTEVFEKDEHGIKWCWDYNYTHAYDSGKAWYKRVQVIEEESK